MPRSELKPRPFEGDLLYLGKRRVPLGVFRQLRSFEGDILGWSASGGFELTRPALGVLDYHWPECDGYDRHLHVVIHPGDALDDLCRVWVQEYDGWIGHAQTKQCADFAGQVRYRGSNSPVEVKRLEEVRAEWSIFYGRLSRLPVLYIGGRWPES